MKAGQLRDRIYIYELKIERSPYGNTSRKWYFKCTTRAKKDFASGGRTTENEEIFYTVEREFIVRIYVPVVETDIIVWNDQKWRIISIDRSEKYNNTVIKTTKIMDEDVEIVDYPVV